MSIGFWQIIIVILIILLVFGSKRIASLGSDLGKALKGFKKEVKEDDTDRNS
ncbi:MAG: twin-arginine translocase TatA/TatE family subunit [Proteobacteria bacterium]|uniref:Sec-independent protein translocase protein TatA n=1 Tax=SAR86 cluster bacterium TaxID=2030880 RepID=A0A937I8D7_9GAMM|nr:twin-arginine translocase TatA/TatE family subunit [SAR86 cluster bacterium]MBL6819915.1 twin-arginine translocase TatA/TatE family subunit [SAR86 cluster bacterium]MDA0344388.1 twin-arginine translocase TatA/TatE family subunit [Pseudomonadota bacterium]MDA0899596.1 twin-arginine translocase TatA/TatE family subunit [Pseudomonadota bacterium]MDA1056388.1 twin-arginine translocase TatA/TatE family subunit [Pseudomonadota bacterium]